MFFHETVSEDSRKKLSRYIVAYNGDIATSINEKTTHILCNDDAAEVCYM